jgi:hypothetical protein
MYFIWLLRWMAGVAAAVFSLEEAGDSFSSRGLIKLFRVHVVL